MNILEGPRGRLTGAASGIERCLAQQLAERGCDLALCDLNAEGLNETAQARARGAKVSAHVLDVPTRPRWRRCHRGAAEHRTCHALQQRGVSLMANSAAVGCRLPVALGITLGRCDMSRAFLPLLLREPAAHL